jgi:hypothetical protein
MAGREIDDHLKNMRFLFSRKFLIFFIPYFLLFLLTSHNALFWDTIQFAGDHPNWYYSNNFRYLLLPDYCDSGHPPAFGMYLAFLWKIFGRSLFVSHAAMLPFIVLIVVQAIRTGAILFPEKERFALLTTLLLLSESVLITQCTLVSPDILVAGFFLLALNAIWAGNKLHLTLAVAIMGIISTRAMMCSVALYLFSLSYYSKEAGRSTGLWLSFAFKKVLPFLPGALLAFAYFAYHYWVKGWVGYPKNSTWAAGFEIMKPARILRNILVLGWRIVDLGKIFTIIVFLFLACKWVRGKMNFEEGQRQIAKSLFVLIVALFLITALPLTLYQGLLGHRYLLPLTISISILTAYLLFHSNIRYKMFVFTTMVLVQLSGHFWTYPRAVSQGWEGTLGHLFFYKMQKEFRDFMVEKGIPKDEVATSPTLMKSDYRLFLTNDTTTFKEFETDTTQYVWYCNVTNAMNRQADYYFRNFEIVKQERRGNVEMVLFKRPQVLNNSPLKNK